MGTLKVDNLQTRGGTALITSGVATSNLLSASALKTVGLPVLLETTTASSSSSVEFTDMNTRGYSVFMVEGHSILPATDNDKITVRVAGTDGTLDTGSIYHDVSLGRTSTGSAINYDNSGSGQTYYRLFANNIETGNETDEGCNFTTRIYNVADSGKFTQFRTDYVSCGSTYVVGGDSACFINEAQVTTKINFYFTGGNIASGTFKLYGIT